MPGLQKSLVDTRATKYGMIDACVAPWSMLGDTGANNACNNPLYRNHIAVTTAGNPQISMEEKLQKRCC